MEDTPNAQWRGTSVRGPYWMMPDVEMRHQLGRLDKGQNGGKDTKGRLEARSAAGRLAAEDRMGK